ncbi:MAG: 3-dehydroquinate synthase [Gaiellaceae bacterium]|nr:3-dehydroquinate synthase [Gaiellaceae bacterium]
MVPHALERHLALVGFMGAGKSTVGADVAERLGRPFVDLDAEIERRSGRSVQEHFAGGEAAFRAVEEAVAADVLGGNEPAVVALGGGAVLSERTRGLLRRHAHTVLLEVDAATAWERARSSERPLARSEEGFHELFAARAPVYDAVAAARARDADEVVLRAGGVELGALESLELPGSGAAALVSDAHVAGIWGAEAQLAVGARLASTHELPRGEAAKTLASVAVLWEELRLDRAGTLVALGGGCTTDAVGFAAATYLRGLAWVAVPTTLVGQVDAAIGGKTAIDLPDGKNLVGAFHWPVRTLIDAALLETLAEEQWRDGLAEVVKTGLLAGRPLWELPRPQLVARCAAFKTAVCLRDPYDRGDRNQLNLGHTFAHALEAAAGFELPHGRAVALGLLAALRLSGLDTTVVEEQLRPQRVRADRERAWAALRRDKKAKDGAVRLVLLDAPGKPRLGVELPEADVRAALDELIEG